MAKVYFKRKTTQEIQDLPIEDGALIYNIENGKTYMDYGEERLQTGGNAETMIAIGGEQPTDEDIKIWFPDNTTNTKASEVINSMDGNETDLSPSVNAVKSFINERATYSTNEKVVGTWIDGKPIYRKVIDFGNLPNTGFKTIEHNINDIDTVINIQTIGKTQTDNFYPIPFVGNGSMFNNATATIRINLTELTIATTTDVSNHTATIIIEYTKEAS